MRFQKKSLLFVIIAFASFLLLCKKQTEEDRIKGIVKMLADSAGKKDIKTIKKYISRDYRDKSGNDHDALKGLLAYYFLQHPRISVFITEQEVVITGQTAVVDARAVLTSGEEVKSLSDILPDSMTYYAFHIEFKNMDNEWLIFSADWSRVGEGPKDYKSIHQLQMEEH